MPVYFAHGFRWPRAGFTGIRVHVILHSLDNTSAEYVQNAQSQDEIVESFRKTYPDIMKELDGSGCRGLTLLEEYDQDDESSENVVSRPWAFVCDYVRTLPAGKLDGGNLIFPSAIAVGKQKSSDGDTVPAVTAVTGSALSLNVSEIIAEGPGSTPKAWEALADLRDKLADGEKIDWWIIYNGDPERPYDDLDDDNDEEDGGEFEDGDIVYKEPVPNPKLFVAAREAVIPPNPLPRRPQTAHEGRVTNPDTLPLRPRTPLLNHKGKRQPALTALPLIDKSLPAVPSKERQSTPKPESSLRKKFFGRNR